MTRAWLECNSLGYSGFAMNVPLFLGGGVLNITLRALKWWQFTCFLYFFCDVQGGTCSKSFLFFIFHMNWHFFLKPFQCNIKYHPIFFFHPMTPTHPFGGELTHPTHPLGKLHGFWRRWTVEIPVKDQRGKNLVVVRAPRWRSKAIVNLYTPRITY